MSQAPPTTVPPLPVAGSDAMQGDLQLQLERSELFYRTLFNATSDLIQSVGEDGAIVFANRQWRETLGYNDEDLKRIKVWDILAPDCLEHCGAAFQRLMQGEQVGLVEPVFIAKSGQRVETQGFAYVYTGSDGHKTTLGFFRNTTLQEKAEREALVLKKALDVSQDAVFIFDAESLRFSYTNRGACNITGYSADELLGMHPHDLKPQYSEKEFRKLLEPLLQGQRQSLRLETMHSRKNGEAIPVEALIQRLEPRTDFAGQRVLPDVNAPAPEAAAAQGPLPSWRTLTGDLREHGTFRSIKQIPATMIESGLLCNVPYASFRFNGNAELNFYGDPENPAAIECGTFGEDGPGSPDCRVLREVIAGHLRSPEAAALEALDRQHRDTQAGRLSFRFIGAKDPDGYGANWFVAYQPDRLEQAKIEPQAYAKCTRRFHEVNTIQFLNIVTDISERKAAQRALLDSRTHLSEALLLARAVQWSYDINASRFDFGENFPGVFGNGQSATGACSMSRDAYLAKVVHPSDALRVKDDLAAAALPGASDSIRHIDYRFLRTDGTEGYLHVRYRIQRDAQGLAVSLQGMSQDVTASHLAAEEKNRLNRELEERVRLRTQDLHKANAELKRSNDELAQFAYAASHDLKEPLRAVSGCLHLLEARNIGHLDDRSQELARHAASGAERMSHLIDDLLTLSRVASETAPPRPVDCNQALRAAQDDLSASIDRSGAKITSDPLPFVEGNEVQIRQVFSNLLGNAIKFRSESAPVIHVGYREMNDGYAEFSVRDNGTGFDTRYTAKIWGMFQRLNKDQAGTGVGLAICKKIVERHGGTIDAESEAGKGSVFRFTLPLVKKNA